MEYTKLKECLNKNNGYITTNEIEKCEISKTSIPELIKNNIIRKVSHGLYIDNNLIEDEYFILQKRFPNCIFSYNTACHLLDLSDRAPYVLDITTTYNRKITESNVNVHYISDELLNLGKIEFTSPYGNKIYIYNAERCVCDILKNQDEVDIEVYNKIIKNYFKSRNKNLILLEEYAKKLNVHEKLVHIMEVLL